MRNQNVICISYHVGRVILAVVLLLSGCAKFMSLKSFADEVAKYSELYVSDCFVPLSQELAIVVCVVEFLLGIMLLLARLPLLSLSATLVVMTFFLYLTSVNYMFPTILGRVESCGCFGELIHFTALGSFVKSIALWLLSFVVIILHNVFYHKKSDEYERVK